MKQRNHITTKPTRQQMARGKEEKMADNTPAQREAVKRYVAQTEQWQVRTKDPKRMQLLKQAKENGNLPDLFFEFLEKKFK